MMKDDEQRLKERLRAASRTFRKRGGRHVLKTGDVIYCAFGTGRLTVERHEAQRSAPARLARFGLSRAEVAGRTVLDLGSHTGAMLFELSNWGPASGLGIEYDEDKVRLAREISAWCGLGNLRFEQGDLDRLDTDTLGMFDIVFALAIEAHVRDPERLYALLGRVTCDLLCFEGNSGCKVDEAERLLRANGFNEIHHIGFCDDDIRP